MEVMEELIKNSMDLLAAMAAADIASDLNISNTQALAGLLSSLTGQMLVDLHLELSSVHRYI